ncbi:hypothetical protein GC177_02235 [bacterium]|nr:hypothetical protein [bacterium]
MGAGNPPCSGGGGGGYPSIGMGGGGGGMLLPTITGVVGTAVAVADGGAYPPWKRLSTSMFISTAGGRWPQLLP